MFDLLKKKISGFVDALTKKETSEAKEKILEAKPVKEEKPAEKPTKKILAEAAPAMEKKPEKKPVARPEVKAEVVLKKEEERLVPKLGILGKVKALVSGEVEIHEKEVNGLLSDLEVSLLESDVSYDAALFIESELKKRLVGKKFSTGKVGDGVRREVASVVSSVFPSGRDLFSVIDEKKAGGQPTVVMFLGPNGMGKSTTIAKLASLLKERGYSSVIAAADTFRAAAIPQIKEHGERLGIPVVAHGAGSDPTAVAFDAITLAKSRGIDCVLIDTAGRQETNYNLVREMEKMNRVLKPDYRVFVAEAIAGHSVVEQVKKFDEAAGGVDGVILTKVDCDAKGGGAVGIAFESKKPVLFICTGQEYKDIRVFDPVWFANSIAGVAE